MKEAVMNTYIDEVETRKLISNEDWITLAQQLSNKNVNDVADVLLFLDDNQRRELTTLLAQRTDKIIEDKSVHFEPPFLELSYTYSIKKRIGWLILLMIGQMSTASVLDYFDNQLEKALVLAIFIPMIISSGGNSGSQAATLIIRAMALGQVQLKDWLKVIYRESITGVIIGIILGLIAFSRILVVNDHYGEFWLYIGVTIAVSTAVVVITGSILGSILPLILKALGTDPAASSAPFVATLADVSGLILYFLIAISLLEGKIL